MTEDPLVAVDRLLAEKLDRAETAAWRSYTVWTTAWALGTVATFGFGVMLAVLIIIGEGFVWAAVATAAGLAESIATWHLGVRAGERWRQAFQMGGSGEPTAGPG